MTRLTEVLQGNESNYILPFLWQHGEDAAVIREEIARVHESGIRAVCVEARPHPDFLGLQWWRDMDVIMDEARRRGMRVWILDDDHFPTGHAAGAYDHAPPALRRLFLKERHVDALGPQPGARFPIESWLMEFRPELAHMASVQGTLIAAVAYGRDPASNALRGERVDLTGHVCDDTLVWDVPAGHWRVFLLFSSPEGGTKGQQDYMNPLVAESVRVLIDTVYEAFYARYPDDFGHTFAGFFSDEPGFYNDPIVFDYQSKPGKIGVELPWRADMLDRLAAEFGAEYRLHLPLLWYDGGETTTAVRYAYMQVASRLYGQHFTTQLGDWCRAHKIEYIGHVIEDNGAHAHLGCGAGHYFRSLWGQDMAGIDVVLWQLAPGFDAGPFGGPIGDWDGEFFHYGLAKMASSLAHIDPKKRGRAMCEVFGAYGWVEGLKLMKWMTDHMLVRGVNYFVPHAFSQAPFPDPDCPPHMYAHGQNPQFRHYRALNDYTNRLSHLLSGGAHVASAAVLYHAEAEWSGAWMPFHKPVRELLQHQVDCDVLPADCLLEMASVTHGSLAVEQETFGCLVVPWSAALPGALLARLADIAEQGLPLIFVDGLPARSSEGRDVADALRRLTTSERVHVAPLAELAQRARELGCYDIEVEVAQPYLRFYHVRHADLDVYMFCNEHPHDAVSTTVHLPIIGRALRYDAFSNRLSELDGEQADGGIRLALQLSPYESLVVVAGGALPAADLGAAQTRSLENTVEIAGPWSLALATSEQYPHFQPTSVPAGLPELSESQDLARFSGTLRYATTFEWSGADGSAALDLGAVYETAEVWLNDQPAGLRICPPYRLDIGDLLRPGANRLVVEVTNTLANAQRDFFSRFAHHEPSGLIGPVRVLF